MTEVLQAAELSHPLRAGARQSKSKQHHAVTCRNANLNKLSSNTDVRAVSSIGADCNISSFEGYSLKRLYALIAPKN